MLGLFYATWCIGAVLKGLAVCRMVKNGLARRYWLLSCYLAISTLMSLGMMAAWHHQRLYTKIHTFAPILMLAESAAVIGVFLVLVENYQHFKKIGIIGISILTLISVVAAWITRNVGASIPIGVRETALLWERYESLVVVGVLAGIALFLPRSRFLPLRVSAQRATALLALEACECLLVAAASMLLTPTVSSASDAVRWTFTLVPFCFRIITGGLWLFWMTPAADADPVIPVLTDEDLERHRRESTRQMELLTAEMREALRHLDQSL